MQHTLLSTSFGGVTRFGLVPRLEIDLCHNPFIFGVLLLSIPTSC
jgi:hypothetical protein